MATASGLPKQVEEQAALAEEFMSTLTGRKKEEDTDENEEQDVSSDSEEEGQEEEGSAEDDNDLETADQDDTEDEEDPEEESYRKRYETLQGKYNAEVPRLNTELRELKDKIFEKLGDVSKKVAQPTEEVDTDDGFAEELAEAHERFGDDLIDFIDKLTERKAKQLLGESLAPVSQKVDSVESAQIQSAQTAFKQDLSEKVEGDWEPLWGGKDEGFKEFLATKEPNGFFTYGEVAKLANDNWDADKLALVFNAYLAGQKPVEKKTNKANERTNQQRVTPKRNKVASEPDGSEPMIWTQADIREFQKLDRMGKIPKEEAEAKWNDLLRAPSENRIVN